MPWEESVLRRKWPVVSYAADTPDNRRTENTSLSFVTLMRAAYWRGGDGVGSVGLGR